MSGSITAYLPLISGIWALFWSVVSFCAMGVDKRRAQKNAWRVPERRLFLFALLGGAWGGWLGMRVFRHKTKHWYFSWGFPLIAVLETAGVIYLLTNLE